jgi:hypothetical protein
MKKAGMIKADLYMPEDVPMVDLKFKMDIIEAE